MNLIKTWTIQCILYREDDLKAILSLESSWIYYLVHESIEHLCVCCLSVCLRTARIKSGSSCRSRRWTTDWTLSCRSTAHRRFAHFYFLHKVSTSSASHCQLSVLEFVISGAKVSFNILTELQPLSLQSVSVSYCVFLNSLTVILKFEQKKHDLNVVPSTSDHWWILSIIIFCVHLPWSRTRCENLESSVICCNSTVWPAGGDDNTWRWRQLVQKYSLRKRGVMFVFVQISRLCPEEAAAQEQTGQVEECLKVNLLKIKQEGCKKVN